MPEEMNRRAADRVEFGRDIAQLEIGVVRMLRPGVLVEARQWRAVVS